MSAKIPVTVLTGFLGSGKTTLLNRILQENHGQRIAVIENEFGEIGVDQDLVINADEEIFEMNNGCICCTVRGDLIRILGNLAKRKDRFDRVLLETTGLADPGPVAQTFFVDEDVSESFELDGIITLVDAKHITQHLDDSDEAVAQIAFADLILLNKTDLVSEAEQKLVSARISEINAMATILPAQMADVPLASVLDVGGFDLDRALETKPTFLEPEYPFEWAGIYALPASGAALKLMDGPDPYISVVLTAAAYPDQSIIAELAEHVAPLFSLPATAASSGQPLNTTDTHYRVDLSAGAPHWLPLGCSGESHIAIFTEHTPEEFDIRICCDGKRLEPLSEQYFAASHSHDDTVGSVAVEFPGRLDGKQLNDWLSLLLRTNGQDIFRMKGIVALQGEDVRFVFQGVHMLFTGQAGKPWADETPFNRMIFIGRNLDGDMIEAAFRRCLV